MKLVCRIFGHAWQPFRQDGWIGKSCKRCFWCNVSYDASELTEQQINDLIAHLQRYKDLNLQVIRRRDFGLTHN